jgi:hypothetical protein
MDNFLFVNPLQGSAPGKLDARHVTLKITQICSAQILIRKIQDRLVVQGIYMRLPSFA